MSKRSKKKTREELDDTYAFGVDDNDEKGIQKKLFDDWKAMDKGTKSYKASAPKPYVVRQKVYQPVAKPEVAIRFTPYAWAKLMYIMNKSQDEVSGFGICEDKDKPTTVTDFALVKQEVSYASVSLNDESVSYLLEDKVCELGLTPEQVTRIWIHTHPGSGTTPSGTDEDTFQERFSDNQWACMLIVGRDGSASARVQYNVGPHAAIELPVMIDWTQEFRESDHASWDIEFEQNVSKPVPVIYTHSGSEDKGLQPIGSWREDFWKKVGGDWKNVGISDNKTVQVVDNTGLVKTDKELEAEIEKFYSDGYGVYYGI